MKRVVLASLGLAMLGVSLDAQQVTPVWVHHLKGSVNSAAENKLPLVKQNVGAPYASLGLGRSKQVSLGKLRPYDSTRMLMMIRENGIDEADASLSDADKALAAAYPDRSLIWVEAATGKPLGLAHAFGIRPVVATGQANNNDFFSNWDIDQGPEGQRVVYSTHKNTILRWAPKAGGGWESTPTYAWIEPTPGAKDENGNDLNGSSGGDGNNSWRWRDFRVHGAGADTRFVAGGGTWRASMHVQIFTTTDGLKFAPIARFNDRDGGRKGNYSQGGLTSSLVQYGLDPERPNLMTAYHGRYPGTGWEARPSRFILDPDNPTTTYDDAYAPTGVVGVFQVGHEAYGDLPAYQWESAGQNGLSITHAVDGVAYYDGNWGGIMDAHKDVDYIVNWAFPSWNNQFGSVKKPGWIGVHRRDGSIAANSAYQIPLTEMDIQSADAGAQTGNDFGYDGDVTIYPDADAPAELDRSTVVWVGSGYGYGVFTVQNTAASIIAEPQDITLTENANFTLVANVGGSPNTYRWFKDGVALDPEAKKEDESLYYPRSVVQGVNKSQLGVRKAQITDSGKYKLVVTNPFGEVTTREAIVNVTADTVAPTIVSTKNGRSADSSYVSISFSEEMTLESISDAANYKLNGNAVAGAKALNAQTAIVYIPTIEPGAAASLAVSGVRDVAAGGGNAIANTSITLYGPVLASGGLLWEFYPGIGGTAVSGLQGDASFPGSPSRWERMSSFNTDASGLSQVADNFGARISGWLTPEVSGAYRFFVRSDDASILYLSDGPDAGAAVEIAREDGCCEGFKEVADPLPQETSAPIELVAGTSYYIAMLYKEGGGGDWAQAAWRREGDTTAAGSLTPIPGRFFSSYRVAGHGPVFSLPTVGGGKVTLTWSGGGKLQESTDLVNWSDVGGNAASPYEVTLAGGAPAKFYRVIE